MDENEKNQDFQARLEKPSSEKLVDKLAIGLFFIIYALIMVSTYCFISYIEQGKLVQLASENSLRMLTFKDKDLGMSKQVDYMLNLGFVVEIICIVLMIGSTIFMVLFLIGMYKTIREKLFH